MFVQPDSSPVIHPPDIAIAINPCQSAIGSTTRGKLGRAGSSGKATYNYTPPIEGVYTVSATYLGDNNYQSSTSTTQLLTVYTTIVVNNNANEPNTPGTLPCALNAVSGSSTPTAILLTFTNPVTVTLTAGISLNPNISLLNASACKTGFSIKGYAGRQLVIPLSHTGKSTFKCIKTSKT